MWEIRTHAKNTVGVVLYKVQKINRSLVNTFVVFSLTRCHRWKEGKETSEGSPEFVRDFEGGNTYDGLLRRVNI